MGLRLIAAFLCFAFVVSAQTGEDAIRTQLRSLRQLPDEVRARTTRDLALQIRGLPNKANQLNLAMGLASLATEGDFGRDTLQEVTTTLAEALRAGGKDQDARAYVEVAKLVRYEHMQATLDDPQFAAAMAKLEADDRVRDAADFSLSDLKGKTWTLKSLRGKVVLVNFLGDVVPAVP
jgi:hypothetical protein